MKAYVKPDLVYENFELSDSIAVCMWDMINSSDKDVCYAVPDATGPVIGGQIETLFSGGNKLCQLKPEMVQDYCYQPGADQNVTMVFNS